MTELVILAGAMCLFIIAANLNTEKPCHACYGKGMSDFGTRCPVCKGSGRQF